MIARFFHAWERRLASVTTDRVVRPFEWGLDWLAQDPAAEDADALRQVLAWSDEALADGDRFFAATPAADCELRDGHLTFSSALATPHAENNVVHARYFPASSGRGQRSAVVVLPQWNADADGHVGLCRLLARYGMSALRLSLPYHDQRMPPELHRADFIVSANIGRTLQVCRQAVLDTRRAVAWLADRGYERIGILGTSLGSCLAHLAIAHEPLLRAAALNHVSPYFADVVWRGLSTAHVREGLEGRIDLDNLRRAWMPISPFPYIGRLGSRRVLLVYARYDLTFPVDLSRVLVGEFQRQGVPYETVALPCGHYTTGVTPFKWIDGYRLVSFMRRALDDAPPAASVRGRERAAAPLEET